MFWYRRCTARTAARPEAVFDLHSGQIDRVNRLVDLLPKNRKQVAKKYRPVVRLPVALQAPFEGYAVSYEGERVKSIKKALWRACDRANVERCSSYSFRHTAARWMRQKGVPPWEISAQLGHSAGKQYTVTERYAPHSPEHLSRAVKVLSELVELTRGQARTKELDAATGMRTSSSSHGRLVSNKHVIEFGMPSHWLACKLLANLNRGH